VAELEIPTVTSASFQEDFEIIDSAARRACHAGLTGVAAIRNSDGRMELRSQTGGFLANEEATFAFGDDRAELTVYPNRAPQTRNVVRGCDDSFNSTPVHVIYAEQTGSIAVSAKAGTSMMLRSGDETYCLDRRSGEDRVGAIVSAEEGEEWEVFANATDRQADSRVEFTVSTLDEDLASYMLTWAPGQTVRASHMLSGTSGDASRFGTECYGNLPIEPTTQLLVEERGPATVGATSSEDAVIAIVGPDGETLCNDDYDGLNPGIQLSLSPGIWEIYVGSWAPGAQFPVEFYVQPR
jgi:hypothetical protein